MSKVKAEGAGDIEPKDQTREQEGRTQFDDKKFDQTTAVASKDGSTVDSVTTEQEELPSAVGAKLHAPYPEKPLVQEINEGLTNDHPTGYVPITAKESDEIEKKAEK